MTRVECFKRYFNSCNRNIENIIILYLTEFEANIDSIGQNNLNDAYLHDKLSVTTPRLSKPKAINK